MEKGKKKWIKKGLQKGVKGNKIETAQKMLELKFSIKDISAVTGLSAKEIEKIRDE